MSYSSSLLFKKVIDDRVWSELAKLWLSISEEEDNILITQSNLFKLASNDQKSNQNQQLASGDFLLLVTPQLNAFLRREPINTSPQSLLFLTFEREIIELELLKLSKLQNWHQEIVNYCQKEVFSKLNHNHNSSTQIIFKTVELLANESEQDLTYQPSSTPPMDKLLHYQVEQERIFEQIKIQISQNINLATIIQTTLDRSRSCLGLDRLLIYQLNVALSSSIVPQEHVDYVDTITYESLGSQKLDSALYVQDKCWHDYLQSHDKYHQGFSLAIADLETENLHPCVQKMMHKMQVKAKVVSPIIVMDELWGFAIAHQCERRHWQNQELQFLNQVSSYLAIAVHNHQSYQQLEQQKLLLEKQVKTQTQQIKDALIAAEAASKSKHEFLGSMSHELRTPLTCVIGLSGTLLQWSSAESRGHLSPEKQEKYLHLIQQNGKHLLSLINNILEFSEVESGKHLLDVQQISLTSVAKQSLQILQEIAAAKQITLNADLKLQPEQDLFFADEPRLKEIIFNLLSNGIKFTPAGGEVDLRIWREKRQIVIQVEDTGIGITDAEMPLLFEKFKQLEDFRQRTQGGTGLGLALTKKLVELHGGAMEVESAVGQGSVFSVYLPEKTPFQPYAHTQKTVAKRPFLASQTIMLITEDEESAAYICQLFNTIDCQVVWLMDSAMGIEQIELLQPRIVIIDRECSTPAVKKLAQAIENKPFANTSLVLLQEQLIESEWSEFAQAGVVDYLLKSMNPSQIIDKMTAVVTKK